MADILDEIFGIGESALDSIGDFGGKAIDTLQDLGSWLTKEDDIFGSLKSLAGPLVDFALTASKVYGTIEMAEGALAKGEREADVYLNNAEVLRGSADLYRENADLLRTEAGNVQRRTYDSIVRTQFQGLKLISQQQSSYLASGVTLEGSPLLVMQETKDLLEMELLRIQEEGDALSTQLNRRADLEIRKGEQEEKWATGEELSARNAVDQGAFDAKMVYYSAAKGELQNLGWLGQAST